MGEICNGFWHGPNLTIFHWACLRSYLRHGHRFHLYVYDDVNAPDGVTLMDANAILPESELFHFKNPETALPDLGPFSDLFRYKLLWTIGGWYVDLDTVCLADEFPRSGRAWTRECPEIRPCGLNGSQLAFSKGDPLAAELYSRCLKRSRNYAVREDLGPHLLTEVIAEYGLPLDVGGTPDTFFPVRWIETFKVLLPQYRDEVMKKIESATFLSIFLSFLRYCGFDTSKLPPQGSYLHDLYASLVPELMDREGYTVEAILRMTRAYMLNKRGAIPELAAVSGPDTLRQIGIAKSDIGMSTKVSAMAVSEAALPESGARFGRRHWERFFGERDDPWSCQTDYEQKRFQQTLSLVPDAGIGRCIEIGCGEGHFTQLLALKVPQLCACDISITALARAANRCRGFDNIEFRTLSLVEDAIPGACDLIVCMEILYYLPPAQLREVAKKIAAGLATGGYLILGHANLVADNPEHTGFDWDNQAFGNKTIRETFLSIGDLVLRREIRTPLYSVQLFQRGGREHHDGSTPVISDAPLGDLPVAVARNVIWNGAVATRGQVAGTTTSAVPILMYHSVADGGPQEYAPYRVSVLGFREQLRTLRRHGYHSITLDEWAAAIRAGRMLSGRPVIITFDDGYQDFIDNALPLLLCHDFSATVFVVTDMVGKTSQWDSALVAPMPLMNWDALRLVQRLGIQIGSHGAAHRRFSELSAAEIRHEAHASYASLAEKLHISPTAFSYPWGECGGGADQIVAQSGYDLAVATSTGEPPFGGPSTLTDDVMRLRRVEILGSDTLDLFEQKLGIKRVDGQAAGLWPAGVPAEIVQRLAPVPELDALTGGSHRDARLELAARLDAVVAEFVATQTAMLNAIPSARLRNGGPPLGRKGSCNV